jgi:hypothetical protein
MILLFLNDLFENQNLIKEYYPVVILMIGYFAFRYIRKIKKNKMTRNFSFASIKSIKLKDINFKRNIILVIILVILILNNEDYYNSIIQYRNIFILLGILLVLILLVKLFGKKLIIKIKNNRTKKSGINKIDLMSGQEFEKNLELLFERKGYKVETTPISGDFGLI